MKRVIKPLLFCYLIIEVIGIYYFGLHIGVFPLFMEIVISAFIGSALLLNIRFSFKQSLLFLMQGRLNLVDVFSGNLAKVIGAVLLILPGVFCDIVGILLLVFAYAILRQSNEEINQSKMDDEVIDVEISSSGIKENNSEILIGTRGSLLALWQAEHIQSRLESELGIKSKLKIVKTKGDKILDAPLSKIGGKGLFTKELEEMLLDGSIDLAVHSLKDVPVEFVAGLDLACITTREDPRDCFLSLKYENLEALPKNARVGTTSLRRSMQIKKYRSDLDTQSLRGNVQTRLKRLENGDFDAIILAKAGLNRLGINASSIRYIIPFSVEEMIPAMGQGALGIEARKDSEIFRLLAKLNDEDCARCACAERAFVRRLEGGCQVPIGVHASIDKDKMHIHAIVGLPDGSVSIYDSITCGITEGESAAISLAESFLDRGAKKILDKAQNWL